MQIDILAYLLFKYEKFNIICVKNKGPYILLIELFWQMFFRLLSLLHSYNATFFSAELENDIWFKMTILKVETEN